MFGLHATKVYNTIEGRAVVVSDVSALHAVMCRPSKIMNFDS